MGLSLVTPVQLFFKSCVSLFSCMYSDGRSNNRKIENCSVGLSSEVRGVALGTATIDSTPAIGVRWRRGPIQPAKYLHQWLSVKLVQTGFQNSGAFVSNHKGLITFDANTEEDGRKNASWSRRRRKETQESRPALRDRRLELDFRLERRTSSKNELDIHFYIERLLSSHVA